MINIRNCADGRVAEPGLYRMTAEQYHADPCPEPSLSSSTIKTMLERTPRHAFHDHPRLGGMRLESSSAAQTLGSVVHAMVLGAGRQWHVIDADDWRTKAAKAERDAAESVGKVPILRPMPGLATDNIIYPAVLSTVLTRRPYCSDCLSARLFLACNSNPWP